MTQHTGRAALAQVAARCLLGFVLIYFGTSELLDPHAWFGYVPPFLANSGPLLWMILVHGWILFVLGAFVVIGIELRVVSVLSALMLLSIILTLFVAGGLTSILVRDAGILGLAVLIAADPIEAYSWDALEARMREGRTRRAGLAVRR